MKKIKYICCCILLLIIIDITNTKAIVNLNDIRFFIRVSEKYDSDYTLEWENILKERNNILKFIRNNDLYEEYKEYTNIMKNKSLFRTKRNYVKKLNYYIENNDIRKIKRYLKLILNIFIEENKYLVERFNVN